MTAREQIEKAYEMAGRHLGYAKIIDILNATDIPTDDFSQALREMTFEGWSIIGNCHGGDVTSEERAYCPMIGNQQKHLIAKI